MKKPVLVGRRVLPMRVLPLPRRTLRRIAVSALGCAAIIAPATALAAPSSPAATQANTQAATATLPVCQPSGLVIWLDTNGSGAAGTIFYKLHFTNESGHACTLQGFPFILGVNLAGHQLGNRATFNHTSTPNVVTINNNKTATAILGIVQVGNFSPSVCGPVLAAGLKVFAPTGVATTAKVVPFPFGACSKHGPNYLNVQPLK